MYLKRYSIQTISFQHQLQIYDYFNGNLLVQSDLNFGKTFNILYYDPDAHVLALYESDKKMSENNQFSLVFIYNYFEFKLIPPKGQSKNNKADTILEDIDNMHHFTIFNQPLICRIDFINSFFICDEYYKVNLSKQIITLDYPLTSEINQYQDQVLNIFQKATNQTQKSSEEFFVSSKDFLLLHNGIKGRKFYMEIDCMIRESNNFIINRIESFFICISIDNQIINIYSFLPKPKLNQDNQLLSYKLLRSFQVQEYIQDYKFFFFKNSVLVSINHTINVYNTDAIVSSKQDTKIKPIIQQVDGEIIFIDSDQQTILTYNKNIYQRIWLNGYIEVWNLDKFDDMEIVEYVSSFKDELDNSIIFVGKIQINIDNYFKQLKQRYHKEENKKQYQDQDSISQDSKIVDDEIEEDIQQLKQKIKIQQERGYQLFQTFTIGIDRNTLEKKFYLRSDYRCFDAQNLIEVQHFDAANQQYFLITSCSHLIVQYKKQISEEVYHNFQDHQKLIVKTISQKNLILFYYTQGKGDIFTHSHSSIKLVINNQVLTNQISPPHSNFLNNQLINQLIEICTQIEDFIILFYQQDILVYSYRQDNDNIQQQQTLSLKSSHKIPYNLCKSKKIDFKNDKYGNFWAIALTFSKNENILSVIDLSDIQQGIIDFPLEIQIKKSMGCISDQNDEQNYFIDFYTRYIIAYGRYKLCIFNNLGNIKKEIAINQKISIEFNYQQHVLLFIVQKGEINDLKNFGIIYDYVHEKSTEMKIEKLNPGIIRSVRMIIIGYTMSDNLISFICTDLENQYVYSYTHILNKQYLPKYNQASFLERIKYTNECSQKTQSYERYFIKSFIFEEKNYIVNIYYDSIQIYQISKYLKIVLRLLYCILPENQEESTVKPYRNFLDLKIFETSIESYYWSDIQDNKDLQEDDTLLVMAIVFTNRITLYQLDQDNHPELIAYATFDQHINEIIELSEIGKQIIVLVARSQNNLYTYKFHVRKRQQICSVDWSSSKQGQYLKNKNDIVERSRINYLFNHLKFPQYFYLNHGLQNTNQILDLSYISTLKNIYLYYQSLQKYQMTYIDFEKINNQEIFAIHFESFELSINQYQIQFNDYKSVVLDNFEIKLDNNMVYYGFITIKNVNYVQISNFRLKGTTDQSNQNQEQYNQGIGYIFKFINCKKVKIFNFQMKNFKWSSISSFFILESIRDVQIEKFDVENNKFRGYLIRLNFIISAQINHLIFKQNKQISILDVDNAEEQSTETTYVYLYNFFFSNSFIESNEFSLTNVNFKYGGNIIHKNIQINNNTFQNPYLFSFNPDKIKIIDTIFDGNVLIQTNLIDIQNGKILLEKLKLFKNLQNAVQNHHYTLQYEQNAPQFPIILFKSSAITIYQSQFQDNVIFFMLILAENSQIQVDQCKFVSNFCRNSNMGCCLSTQESSLNLIHSIFIENLSVSGSAGKFYKCIGDIKINGCLFQMNKAQFYGGALLLEQCSQIQIKKSTFIQNEAMIGGAIRYLQTYPYNFLNNYDIYDNKIYNNEAYFYGQNIGSYIRLIQVKEVFEQYVDFDDQMSIIKKDFLVQDQNIIKIFNFTSGRHLQINWDMADEERRRLIQSEIIDLNLKIIEEQDINEKEYEIIKKYDLKISNKAAKILSYQKAIEDNILQIDINLVGEEQGQILVKIKFPDVLIPKNEVKRSKIISQEEITSNQGGENIFMFPLEVYLILEIRPCQQGETQIILQSRETKYFICQECLRGTFSKTVNPNQDTVCKKCDPQNSECFKNYLFTKKGYWRYKESIFTCPYSESCIGGNGQGDDLCQEGYKGALCQSCDSNFTRSSKQFVRYGFDRCIECDSVVDKILNLSLLSILFLLLLIGIAYSSYQKGIKKIQIQYLIKMGLLSAGNSANFFQSVYFAKLLLGYLPMIQLYRKYGSYLDTHVFNVWNKISMIFSQLSYSLECIIAKVFFKIGAFYPSRIVVTSVGPMIVLLTVILITCILHKKKLIKDQLKDSINTQLILIIGLFYSCIAINNLLECLHYIQIEDKNFSLADTSIDANNESYQMFLSYYISIFIIFWTLLVPSLLALKLFSMRNSLDMIKMNWQYGFLFQEYKIKYYFWDFVKLLVRNFIFFFVNLSGQEQLTEDGILIIVTLILYIWSLIAFMPYKKRSHNSIDIALSCSSIVTAFLTTFGYDIEEKEKSLFKICEILTDLLNIVLIIFIVQSMEIMNIKRMRQKFHNNLSWKTLKLWNELRKKVLRYKSQQKQMKSASFDYLPIFDNLGKLNKIYGNFQIKFISKKMSQTMYHVLNLQVQTQMQFKKMNNLFKMIPQISHSCVVLMASYDFIIPWFYQKSLQKVKAKLAMQIKKRPAQQIKRFIIGCLLDRDINKNRASQLSSYLNLQKIIIEITFTQKQNEMLKKNISIQNLFQTNYL
ncbi:transmembrane protein, putative (macronuclear) [Tetrahymena thermophila SB210]|uniref:Transmembrane protein, putative n=1 Tax=Tetrahymena thermophila (strain SB210) TaxID=312017 RepID=I7MID4_TETTS|nr:transmembrane protein, putative [Tetrahymena thermophila SB210]EAS04283.2 transmembrane protein, putative [Tetrahymena thermophila SB210]|eukprot:XP_001024528.2 transmembrane protein, putative [Tetrahymena thermophila SB210]